jgi:acetyl esterase
LQEMGELPPLSSLTPQEARAVIAEMVALGGESGPVGEVRDHVVPVDGGSIALRTYVPAGAGLHPIVVFFHGGGWVIGDLDSHDPMCRHLCAGADCLVASVDYRLAPEHGFPTAPRDSLVALRWVVAHAEQLGGDPTRVAVCGDSAGGNLSAVVSLMARDDGGPHLSFAALIYPATDMITEDDAIRDNATTSMTSSAPIHSRLLPSPPATLACLRASSPRASSTRCATRASATASSCVPPAWRPK